MFGSHLLLLSCTLSLNGKDRCTRFRFLVSIEFEDWCLHYTFVGLTLLISSLRNTELLNYFLVFSLEKSVFMLSLTSDFECQVDTTEFYSKSDSKEEITVLGVVSGVNNFLVT